MTNEYSEQTFVDPRTEEFLEHFGVKGMKWGIRKAVDSPVGRVATAPSRATLKVGTAVTKQGLKNVKTIGGAFKRANDRQKLLDEAYVQKHGEVRATLRTGAKHVGAILAVNKVSSMLVKNMKGHPNRQIAVVATQAALSTGILVNQLTKFQRLDSAAKRINKKAGRDPNAYVSRSR